MSNIILQGNEITFKGLEKHFYSKGCEAAREGMAELLREIDQKLKQERDKTKYRDKGLKKTAIKTLMGEVEFSRTIYEVKGDDTLGKKFVYLLDEKLGFANIGLVSANLAEKIVDNACKTSYKDSAKNISELTGQTISHTGAWNIVQKVGQKAREIEEKETELYRQYKLSGDKKIDILFEEADGVFIKIRGKNRKGSKGKEMKVALFHEGWKKVGKERYELHNKQVICGFEKVEEFVDKKEAKISKIYDIDEIKTRILNSDGASWIKNLHENIDEAHFQLDRFHVKQAILRAISEPEIQSKVTKAYEKQKIERMFMLIDAYKNSICDERKEKKLEDLENYLSNNKDGLIPYQKRNLSLPKLPDGLEYRGMGACEHNVDLTVARRMKHRGSSWSEEGALNLANLLALKASKELPRTMELITKSILPAAMAREIVTVLSAGNAPAVDGKGYTGLVCSRPFAKVSKTNGRAAIDRIFDIKNFSDISY